MKKTAKISDSFSWWVLLQSTHQGKSYQQQLRSWTKSYTPVIHILRGYRTRAGIEGLSRGYRARIGKCGKGSETAKNGLKPARRVALNDFGNTRTLTNAKNGPIFWGFELGSGVKREFVYNNLIYIDGIGSEFDIQIGEVMPGSGHLSRNDREHIEGKRSIFGNTKARGGPFKRLRSQMRSPFIR